MRFLQRWLPAASVVLAGVVASAAKGGGSRFPPSWGEPPALQTKDLRPLAGGYGHGSSTLSGWILKHIRADRDAGNIQFPPAFGEPPLEPKEQLLEPAVKLPFGYGQGSRTTAEWLAVQAKNVNFEEASEYEEPAEPREPALEKAAAGSAPAKLEFPASWGKPPEIQTMDFWPLAGGYGHGSSTLSRWIIGNIEKDRSQGKVQFPPAFGQVPLRQTRDRVPLPFGYGYGSGTIAKWLRQHAQEVYKEDADEYTGFSFGSDASSTPGDGSDAIFAM